MREKTIIVDGIETQYVARDDGTIWNTKTNQEVKGTFARNEFRSVQFRIDGKRKSFMVHRLIAEAFCDNPNGYTIVNHLNGDKYDNRAENLGWSMAKKAVQKEAREITNAPNPIMVKPS